VVDALALLTARRAGGLFQLSATEDFSYADAAFALAEMIGAPKHLVRPRAAPADTPLAERPRFTSLDTARAEAELQWRAIAPVGALKTTLA
jgi:dTDP-4-dehydrorhamnose reductase